jgi:hypothetical protein
VLCHHQHAMCSATVQLHKHGPMGATRGVGGVEYFLVCTGNVHQCIHNQKLMSRRPTSVKIHCCRCQEGRKFGKEAGHITTRNKHIIAAQHEKEQVPVAVIQR